MIFVSDYLYRGPRPLRIEPLKQAGIKTIICLQSGAYEELFDDAYERMIHEDHGLDRIDIACSDFRPPAKWQVEKFFAIVEARGPVYLHCLHGKDRTGFLCAAYRMQKMGWSFKDAVIEMFEHGFHWATYAWWLFELRKWEKK